MPWLIHPSTHPSTRRGKLNACQTSRWNIVVNISLREEAEEWEEEELHCIADQQIVSPTKWRQTNRRQNTCHMWKCNFRCSSLLHSLTRSKTISLISHWAPCELHKIFFGTSHHLRRRVWRLCDFIYNSLYIGCRVPSNMNTTTNRTHRLIKSRM